MTAEEIFRRNFSDKRTPPQHSLRTPNTLETVTEQRWSIGDVSSLLKQPEVSAVHR